MSGPPVFNRKSLAERFASMILSNAVGSTASSGIFFSAPRRTGKSTFLREDLLPALESLGALVIYVDLWADKKADPGDVIAAAVRQELAKHTNVIKRIAMASGLEKVNIAGASFSLEKVGVGTGIALSHAMAELSNDVKKSIVLLIDEAQHAITTDNGYDTLFALKAARDELNSSTHHGLRIVATGSNQDKLAMLRNSKDQAFFGAPLVPFPMLGRDFIEWFCKGVDLPAKLNPDEVMQLFEIASYRPEILGAAVDTLRFDFSLQPQDVQQRFAQAVREQIDVTNSQTLKVLHALTPLQSAVLRVMAHQKQDYAPFEAKSMDLYKRVLEKITQAEDAKADVYVSNIQQALGALQEKSLIWKEKRGTYSLEEASISDLMLEEGMLDPLFDENHEPNSTASKPGSRTPLP